MRNLLGPNTVAGYCTNVHAGTTYAQLLANLDRHSVAVKQQACLDRPMGVGLWLSAATARELVGEHKIDAFRDWLAQHGLFAFTLNGFPYGDFHGPAVKHRVYEPDWRSPQRVRYTLDLVAVLAALLGPDDAQGSISTLPLGWRSAFNTDPDVLEQATGNLMRVVDHLDRLEQETGKLIHLDLEPEPSCCLETTGDVVRLFSDHLDRLGDPDRIRRYLRVCFDTCHGAVMFEDPSESLARYRQAGIGIGKVQVSSALAVKLDGLDTPQCRMALQELRRFQEDRYLHQTVVKPDASSTETLFYEDLPVALEACLPSGRATDRSPMGEWRVHFHVPLFVERFGLLETTNRHTARCLTLLREHTDAKHYEVETYAWDVLPDGYRPASLAEGIARELAWLADHAPTEAAV